MCRFVAEVRSTLLDLWSFVLRNKSNLKKKGKILKEVNLCSLIRVR
jgi:hypothetical protein